jgi:DNA-directed RNA polymerase subunit M/transcription elongation factor TFIIS
MSNIVERNKDIVEKLINGVESIVTLGKKYNISRERVSQIYYKETGSKRGELRTHREELRQYAKNIILDSFKFVCEGCGKHVDHREGHYKRKYCQDCHNLVQNEKRSIGITHQCSTCGKDYHPFTNAKQERKSGYFCSLICYHKFQGRNKNGK